MKPKSLLILWQEISTTGPNRTRFRVRNTRTLDDFLILRVHSYSQGLPSRMEILSCNGLTFKRDTIATLIQEWTLLSNEEEIELLNGMEEQKAVWKVKHAYRKINNL